MTSTTATEPAASTQTPIKAKQAAEMLGCSDKQIYKMAALGLLAGHKVGNAVRVYAESVEEYRAAHRIEPTAPVVEEPEPEPESPPVKPARRRRRQAIPDGFQFFPPR